MTNQPRPTLWKRLAQILIAWAVVSTALFVAAVIGFRIIQGSWHDFGSWWPALLVGAVLGPPVGTALFKLGVSS
jgi:hypothetical protein